ncbi:hypothetical protein SAMN04515669_1446 [Jiangella sp. DSM 45060]|nr:hypothetical protein SAMN04515669_1446 [Jiangella sp. DSM 45060]
MSRRGGTKVPRPAAVRPWRDGSRGATLET